MGTSAVPRSGLQCEKRRGLTQSQTVHMKLLLLLGSIACVVVATSADSPQSAEDIFAEVDQHVANEQHSLNTFLDQEEEEREFTEKTSPHTSTSTQIKTKSHLVRPWWKQPHKSKKAKRPWWIQPHKGKKAKTAKKKWWKNPLGKKKSQASKKA